MEPATGAIAAAAIQSTAQLAGNVMSNHASAKQQRLANAYNYMMWNAENEYNKPSNQMARFAEAGLNPNLIYGQGSSGNAGSAPNYVTADKRYNVGEAVGNALQSYMALKNMVKDAELKDAQIRMLESKGDTEDAKRDQMFIDSFAKRQKMAAEVELMRKKGELTYEQARKIRQEIVDMPEELLLKKKALEIRTDPMHSAPYYVKAPYNVVKKVYDIATTDVDMPTDAEIRSYLETGVFRGSRPDNVGIWRPLKK